MISIPQINDTVLAFDTALHGLLKSAFVPAAQPQGGQAMPAQGQPMMAGGAAVDPATGAPIDPSTGAPIDPSTGAPIDPATGQPMMAGAMPAGMPSGMPQDPSGMAQGAPAQAPSNSPLPDELMTKLQELANSAGAMAENFDVLQKQTDQLGAQQLSLSERMDKLEKLLNGPAPYAGSLAPSDGEAKEELSGADLPLK